MQSGDPPADECPPASLAVCPPKCDTAAMNLDACAALCDQLRVAVRNCWRFREAETALERQRAEASVFRHDDAVRFRSPTCPPEIILAM